MGILDRFRRRSLAPAPVEARPVLKALPPKRSAEGSVTVAPTPTSRPLSRRIFQAAGMGRLEQSWTANPTTVDSLIYQHWNTLVARSREVSENNDHGRKFGQLCRDNIAGPNGFVLQARITDPNGTPDTLAATAIEDAFKRFSRKGAFDVSGTLSRSMVERLIATTLPHDGEFIAIARYGRNLNEFGFAIQIVDPVLLDPQHYEDLGEGRSIKHGIEMDANGKPVAYHFRRYDERQMGYIQGLSRDYDRVPAENVCHIFLPEIVGQKRGLPWMRTSLWRMRMLGGFEDAAVVNARIGASKMGFFKDPDADNDDLEEIPMEGDPGTFEDIGNREFVQWNPQFPEQSIDPFTKCLLRSIASGLNVSYNNLASDLTSVNFSSIRQGALDEREVWKGLQQLLIESWCEWVYERWLQRSLLANSITVSGKPLRYDRIEKYRAVEWQGRRWGWIDPSAEMMAAEKALAMRIMSRSEVIRNTSGRDSDDVWNEIAMDDKTMAKHGVKPEPMAGSPAPSQPNNQDQPE